MPRPDEVQTAVQNLYRSDPEREWHRMNRHRTEFAVTLRALEYAPSDRYQTVAEMILDLKRLPPVLKQLSF